MGVGEMGVGEMALTHVSCLEMLGTYILQQVYMKLSGVEMLYT